MDRDFWDKCADDPNVRDNWIVDKRLKDEDFIKFLKPLLKGKVLEIGCGLGRLSELYDCGIDISPKMLALAPKNREHKVCDGDKIPYPDGSFDSVFCVQVFQHLPSMEPYIREAFRVLKRGGVFIYQYIEGNPDMSGWQVSYEKAIHPLWKWAVATK